MQRESVFKCSDVRIYIYYSVCVCVCQCVSVSECVWILQHPICLLPSEAVPIYHDDGRIGQDICWKKQVQRNTTNIQLLVCRWNRSVLVGYERIR
jgi:hypothetical protein